MTEPVWYDAAGIAAWLEAHGLEKPDLQLGPNLARNYRYFSDGTGRRVSVWVVDRIVTILGHSLQEVPDELRAAPPDRGSPVPRKVRHEIAQRYLRSREQIREIEEQDGAVALAREYGFSEKTIRNWVGDWKAWKRKHRRFDERDETPNPP